MTETGHVRIAVSMDDKADSSCDLGEQDKRGFCALCALSTMSGKHWQTASYPPKELHSHLGGESCYRKATLRC